MDNYPGVSVVIPCFNESETLTLVLEALIDQRYPGEIEIVVVDNGSTDGTREIARSHDVILECEDRKSSYLARNRGLKRGRFDWVAFLDGDCIPERDWIKSMVKCSKLRSADYVAGHTQFATDRDTLANSLLAYRHSPNIQRKYVEQFACIAGGNMLIGRHVFDQLGCFMPVFSGGDIEFSRRAVASGFRLAYADNATVIHQSRLSNWSYLRRQFRIGYGQRAINRSETPSKCFIRCLTTVPWRPGFGAVEPIAGALEIHGIRKVSLWTYLWLERWSFYLGNVIRCSFAPRLDWPSHSSKPH